MRIEDVQAHVLAELRAVQRICRKPEEVVAGERRIHAGIPAASAAEE